MGFTFPLKVKTNFSSLTAFKSQNKEALLIKLFFHKKREQGDRQWLLTELLGEEALLGLESVGIEIALADLYKRVNFENKPVANSLTKKLRSPIILISGNAIAFY